MQQEFNERRKEVESYYDFILAVETGSLKVVSAVAGVPDPSTNDRNDLLRTFRASLFLLLYNLMEATVGNAIGAIFDDLGRHRVSFDQCRAEIRKIVLWNLRSCGDQDHLKANNVTDVLDLFSNFATDAVAKSFQRKNVVSGNVDGRKIRDLSDRYGIVKPGAKGTDLLTVKTNRNDLAHGDKSFAEVGRDYDYVRLGEIKTAVIHYLSTLIGNVTDYLTNQHYLSAPGRP